MKRFYLTTPIYYPNARPHVGSAYTTIVCDAIARYKRMCGHDVAFLTGTDEHGEKLQRAADAAGIRVEEFVAQKRELFKNLWRTLGIPECSPEHPAGYRFVHTSQNPAHVKSVQWMIRQADKAGYIEKKKYEGRYCVYDERYVSDSPEPIHCDICGRPAELISEENYFFKLSAFQDRLLKLYEDHPEFVLPDFRMNEVKSFVKSGLRDISISRRRLKWGIPWPDDPEQVVYVWYDALTSYLTGIGFRGDDKAEPDFEKYWMDPGAERVHMIGKDILRFHAVYWPAFLMAAELPLPKTIFAHGWIYYEQDKMSKSKGNVVYPEPIVKAFKEFGAPGNDALRYYLLGDTPFGLDGNFSADKFVQRYISDLANDLGNLAQRTVSMLHQHFAGRVPSQCVNWDIMGAIAGGCPANECIAQYVSPACQPFMMNSNILSLAWQAITIRDASIRNLGDYDFFYALSEPLGFARIMNAELAAFAPWKLAVQDFNANRDKIATILYTFMEAVRFTAVLVAPLIPQGAARIWKNLGCDAYLGPIETRRIDRLVWGELQPGKSVGVREKIFPHDTKDVMLRRWHDLEEEDRAAEKHSREASTKVESESEQRAPAVAPVSSPATGAGDSAATNQKISIDDFAKVEMRVGEVRAAEPILGATKLLKLQVDIGSEVRQVCAGIAEYYKPEELIGMKVVIVANLQPRKLRGVESNGMIVAASVGPDGKPVLATFKEEVENGSRLK